MTDLSIVDYKSFKLSVKEALDAISADKQIQKQQAILIKPNLIADLPHPITTSSECCEAVIEYIRDHSTSKIIIAEGCGEAYQETDEVFEKLGYTKLSKKYGVPLVDLNYGPGKRVKNDTCQIFKEMVLPEIAFEHYIISVPVLKAHSIAKMTGTLKNMMGFAQPEYYSGGGGFWKKAKFHENMQQSLIDLNKYIVPDLTVMDCSIGMADFHLGGNQCSPPVNKIIAGYNPWYVDRKAAALLGMDWRTLRYISAGITAA